MKMGMTKSMAALIVLLTMVGFAVPQSEAQEKSDSRDSIGNKKIQVAIDKMEKAQQEIEKGDNEKAGAEQEEAIRALQQAKKELENRLQILRKEELERLSANLKARCARMRSMQIAVLDSQPEGTRAVYNSIQSNSDKKPTDNNVSSSLELARTEKEIINEADKMIEVLEGESSAVALLAATQLVRKDMRNVLRRLDVTDVGMYTQKIEQDIIDSLSDMIKTLDKKKPDVEKAKEVRKKPSPPRDENAPNLRLLDQIAELKIIRSMQVQLYNRTKAYAADKFNGQEQLAANADPNVHREISELRERQQRILEVTNDIRKGGNKARMIFVRSLNCPPELQFRFRGHGLTTLKNAAAVKKLVGEEEAKALMAGVNFDEEMIVLVLWETGGPPYGWLDYEVKGKELTFYVHGPNVIYRKKALMFGADFFAIPRNVSVTFDPVERNRQ